MHHQRSACAATHHGEHRPAQRGQERPVAPRPPPPAQPTSRPGVQRDHQRVVAARRSRPPPRARAPAQRSRRATTSSASRSTPTSDDQDVNRTSRGRHHGSPVQQHQLGAEARAPSRSAARGCPAAGGRSASVSAQDVQHRRRRQVADLGQRAPGQRQRVARAGRAPRCDGLDHLGPARVAHPAADVRRGQPVVGEERRPRRRRGTRRDHVGTRSRRARSGTRCRRRPSPSPARCPGRAGCGWRRTGGPGGSPVARRRRPPTTTTAAAPSPNRPLATRFATESSSRWKVSEHSSTDSSTATSSGCPTQVVVQPGDARPRPRRSRARTPAAASRPAAARAARRAGRPGTVRRRR